MLFQLVEMTLDDQGHVIKETRTQPLFELHDDAMAMAEFAAARCHGDYGYDAERDCWWACNYPDRMLRFVVQPVAALDVAA
jgi:hypothetical protein